MSSIVYSASTVELDGRRLAAGVLEYGEQRTKRAVEAKRGFILDVQCGRSKYPNAVGMDSRRLPDVDVLHDSNDLPWPFESGAALTIIASHVVHKIDPTRGHFVDWMNEAWRVLRPRGQLALVAPYGFSTTYIQSPLACNPCNERTWLYFDPLVFGGEPYSDHEPAPWEIEKNEYLVEGTMEVVLRKREDRPEWHFDGEVHYR